MTEEIKNNQPPGNDDEIDLIALAKTLWNGRKTIIKTTLVFALLGLFIAFLTPKQYTVDTIMVPQVGGDQNKLGGLSSLAAMAGFNMDMNSGSELSPIVYPQIVQSIPFRMELMNTKLNFEGYDEKISFYDFYTNPKYAKFNVLGTIKKYTLGLPGILLKAIRGEKKSLVKSDDSANIIQLSNKEMGVIGLLGSIVSLNADAKNGYITLTSNMSEAKAAAQLAQKAQELLQEKIIEYKIEKAKNQLEFVQERYNEKQKEFNNASEKLARVRDKNKNILTEIGKTELERVQNEFQIISAVFTELSKQLENSKIQVKKETPVFSIIEPVTVPVEKSAPNRPMILIIWTFLGGVIAVGWIFGKQFLAAIKTKWNETEVESLQ